MLGGGRAVFGASYLNTSVFLMLTVSPNDVAAVAKQYMYVLAAYMSLCKNKVIFFQRVTFTLITIYVLL